MKALSRDVQDTGKLVDDLNFILQSLSLKKNFDSFILSNVTLTVGQESTFPHNLKGVPDYFLILKKNKPVQIYASDDTPWNDKLVYLKVADHSGSSISEVKATIIFMRG